MLSAISNDSIVHQDALSKITMKWLSFGRNLLAAMLIVFFGVACCIAQEKRIVISEGPISRAFLIAPEYLAHDRQVEGSMIIMEIDYPSLKPILSQAPEAYAKAIRVIVRIPPRLTRTEGLLDRAYSKRKVGSSREYFAGVENGYRVFKANSPKTCLEIQKTYVFTDMSGVSVGVEDGGDRSRTYVGNRRVDRDLEIRYQYAKLIDVDFRIMDSEIVDFVMSLTAK